MQHAVATLERMSWTEEAANEALRERQRKDAASLLSTNLPRYVRDCLTVFVTHELAEPETIDV